MSSADNTSSFWMMTFTVFATFVGTEKERQVDSTHAVAREALNQTHQ